jgi:5-oxoprolinase (ATP-hydrolysing)
MKSDGGLCATNNFFGCDAILSGPAGGIVGYSKTSFEIINKFNSLMKINST